MAINENQIRDNITKQVQNEIDQQRQSINNGLSLQKQSFDNTINQNNSYLTDQIKKLNTQRIQSDDTITALQNRRGGFYSGGLDYQLAENLKGYNGQQDNVRKDITNKNNEVLGQYNQLAGQAANQIKLLESQAPDKIRQLVNEELSRQQAIELERQKFDWEKQMQQQQLALERQRAAASAASARQKAASSASTPKQKSKQQSYNEGLAFWGNQIDQVRNQGASRVEEALMSDPNQIQALTSQGYDVNSVIDALYSAASSGRWATKGDYLSYRNSLMPNANKQSRYNSY